MIDVRNKHCSRDQCTIIPTFNFEGSRNAAYCKQHAEDDMVNVLARRSSHATYSRQPSFNVQGSNVSQYYKQHAVDGMLNVWVKVNV